MFNFLRSKKIVFLNILLVGLFGICLAKTESKKKTKHTTKSENSNAVKDTQKSSLNKTVAVSPDAQPADLKEQALTEKKSKVKPLDKIVVRVNGSNILSSDLKKKRISKNAQPFTLDEAIVDELLLQKAQERKLLPTELEVEKQIVSLKINNGLGELTDAQFNEELKKEGFTLEDYKKEVARMFAVERFKHAEFSENVVVTSQEVEEVYKKNPVKIQERYSLQICDLHEGSVDSEGKLVSEDDLKWDDIGWINKSDLSAKLSIVSKMEKGELSKPIKNDAGYQLVKLVDKQSERSKTLKECYMEIERDIFDQKRLKFEKEFEKELTEKASIVYLDKALISEKMSEQKSA